MKFPSGIYRMRMITLVLCYYFVANIPLVWTLTAQARASAALNFHRQAPFCVDVTNTQPYEPGLQRFVDVFEHHNNPEIFVPVSKDGKRSPSGFIKNFEVKAIHVKDEDSKYEATLRNWVHIKIEAEDTLNGLYVQAISMPWGIPFGEFVADFSCGDCTFKTGLYKDYINIVPCLHRPALSWTHPNVFTVGGKGHRTRDTRIVFKEMHFHFRYTQYPCMEHTYAQFLIIAVRSFDRELTRFETYYSGVYELKIDDNPIGAYHPFYYGWPDKFLSCHTTDIGNDFKLFGNDFEKLKLRYNKVFDDCIMKKEGRDWYTCKPGPISFMNPPQTKLEWDNHRKQYERPTTGVSSAKQGPQFCPDCGTWEWTLGKPTWPITHVIVDPKGIPIQKTLAGEDDLPTNTGHCGAITNTAVAECEPLYIDDPYETCTTIHTSHCDPNTIPEVDYGKDANGSRIKKDWNDMTFDEQFDDVAWRWAEKYVLKLHGQLLIFSWTAAFNVIVYCARFMKEDTVVQKRSSYHGIGNWIWYHKAATYICTATMAAGGLMVSFQHVKERSVGVGMMKAKKVGLHDLCNVRSNKADTESCLDSAAHGYVGALSVLFYFMSYVTGWHRPESTVLRYMTIIYHFVCAYLAKVLGIIAVRLVSHALPQRTVVYIFLLEISNLLIFLIATVVLLLADKQLTLLPKRKICPVPEAVDTFSQPAYKVVRIALFPIHAAIQVSVFVLLLLDEGT